MKAVGIKKGPDYICLRFNSIQECSIAYHAIRMYRDIISRDPKSHVEWKVTPISAEKFSKLTLGDIRSVYEGQLHLTIKPCDNPGAPFVWTQSNVHGIRDVIINW